MAHYIDASALVKLVLPESESAALLSWLAEDERRPTSCELARTELLRAVRRESPEQDLRAWMILERIDLTALMRSTFDRAGVLGPPGLRALDAIHLAAALDLGDDLEGMVTYDQRQAEAARANGIPVVAPA
ncbi:MAG TPA: type II toxin-antitoxin system VapC family toxin [Iamia sp.]|nr:type II toxin-antitoxin system VapC family toxin [Iamia sp.]